MTIRDLEVVLAVASSGSTTAAASRLNVTQSAISRALRQAEEKLEVELFQRGTKGLVPSSAGAHLVNEASPLLAEFARMEDAIIASSSTPTHVRLVCECYTAYRWLPSALVALKESWPSLHVEIAMEHTDDPAAALRDGDIEIALLSNTSLPDECRHIPLFSDFLKILLSETHPLASKSLITGSDLVANRIIISSSTPKSVRRWFMQSVFGRKRTELDVITVPLTEAIIDLVRNGFGIGIMSNWIAGPYLQERHGLVSRPLEGRPLTRSWCLGYRQEHEAIAKRLAGELVTLDHVPNP